MFNSRILFVLGAGASKEVGLPIGKELTDIIASKVDIRFKGFEPFRGDLQIIEALRQKVRQVEGASQDINSYIRAGSHITDAMPQGLSIDPKQHQIIRTFEYRYFILFFFFIYFFEFDF